VGRQPTKALFILADQLIATYLGIAWDGVKGIRGPKLGFSDQSSYAEVCSSLKKTGSATPSGPTALLSISRRN
jgi:hypothetical protein